MATCLDCQKRRKGPGLVSGLQVSMVSQKDQKRCACLRGRYYMDLRVWGSIRRPYLLKSLFSFPLSQWNPHITLIISLYNPIIAVSILISIVMGSPVFRH